MPALHNSRDLFRLKGSEAKDSGSEAKATRSR